MKIIGNSLANLWKGEMGKIYENKTNFEIRNAISKLRLSWNKLAVVTGKWYKIKKKNRVYNFCNLNAIDDELHFLIDCQNYKKLRESTLKIYPKY